MRTILLSILGIAILAGSFFLARKIMAQKEDKPNPYSEKITKVFIEEVQNRQVPIAVKVNGRLEAVDELELYSEVQGVFQSQKKFRPGTAYKKGELLIEIDDTQDRANLKAQRSSLLNQIVQLLPDIKFDYPDQYEKWSGYVEAFDINKRTQALPEPGSEREKFFIAGKNLSTAYYNIKQLEAQLDKYRIHAPFDGVLTESLVNPGTLIRPGQKLGTLTSQNNFELALPIREEYAGMLRIGTWIVVESELDGREIKGRLIRVNPSVDPGSQSVTAYVKLNSSGLREGMFFNAQLPLAPIDQAMEINRKLVVKNQFLYGVEDSILVEYPVTPVHYNKETVVVRGLEDGKYILERMIPAAREGMKVEVIKQ
ncbi:MAG TPA: HlyD family efflux transporter periplasmic adaptor subunit [Saprospiraceae bacterium]|nr:HlyD family efflux transporter periplasmic adaptor subunit [Saprospiraceae bacterium]